MNYRDNDLYKAFRLKLNLLEKLLQGNGYSHTLSKISMFSEDAFAEQQAIIDLLEREKNELIELIMVSNMSSRYQMLQSVKQIVREKVK